MYRMTYSEYYPTDEEIESFKAEGWKKLETNFDPYVRAHIFLHRIIWSHYWRARKIIENNSNRKTILRKIRGKKYYKGYILDIDHYTKHWYDSMIDYLKDLGTMDNKTEEELLKLYEPEECKYLPKRHTIYQI